MTALPILALILFASLGCIALLARWGQQTNQNLECSVNILQAFLTTVALLTAGYWYFVERAHKPHLLLEHRATLSRLTESTLHVFVELSLKNEGKTLLKIENARARLLHVAPLKRPLGNYREWPSDLSKITMLDGKGNEVPVYARSEIDWGLLHQLNRNVPHDIEPGEADYMYFDFLVDCSRRLLKISAEVRKPNENPERWWVSKSVIDTTEACQQKLPQQEIRDGDPISQPSER